MKKPRAVHALLLTLCILLTILPMGAEASVTVSGAIPDQNLYGGAWQDAYLQILYAHAAAIWQYQARSIECNINGRDYSIPCRPVALQDLTGDGLPELIFMETAENGARGDLYAYGCGSGQTRCILYVPGVTRLDYDDFLGFDIYLTSGVGDALVIERYEYETPWVHQFTFGQQGVFELAASMTVRVDYSGESDDLFYRNGQEISAETYSYILNALRLGKTREISSYLLPDYSAYGLDATWETAVQTLQGTAAVPAAPSVTAAAEIYGLAIQKLATRTGPSTKYAEGGTYEVKGQYIQVLAKAYDKVNEIWWVKCVIPDRGKTKILWTGYKRFDPATLPLELLPEEKW